MSWFFDASICFGSGQEAGWTVGPAILAPLLLIGVLYLAGAARLRARSRRNRADRLREMVLFGAGWLVLALALVTPLHALSQRLSART